MRSIPELRPAWQRDIAILARERNPLLIAAVLALAALALLAPPAAAPPVGRGEHSAYPATQTSGSGADARRSLTIGRSLRGRPIKAVSQGEPDAAVRVLVVGSIHGDETAGHAVVRRLRSAGIRSGVELWTVRSANPDGVALGTRQNAGGVDLNRNFPYRWRRQGRPFSTYHSGTRPLSEPESRAVRRLVRRIRPDVTVWYHQSLRLVDLGSGAEPRLVRGYGRRVQLPVRRIGFLSGVATRWQNRRFPGTSAFVVELPAGRLSRKVAERHARAVLAVARMARRHVAATSKARPPRVRAWRIPFGQRRKQQMRRYARRHYGIADYRLRDPRVVVLHLSVSDSARSVFETFAPNRPDPELGELPGVCAHYVVDPRGRIFQLVSLRLMCRHTVGLNHVSIGIEHVGRREADVFHRRRQLRASIRLVRWLQERYGIRMRDVIGHNESRRSPYHRERVARLRRQTHADFPGPAADRYRRLLGSVRTAAR
jgi:murein peptide amidase A